jgi:hypothetical protein
MEVLQSRAQHNCRALLKLDPSGQWKKVDPQKVENRNDSEKKK